MAPDYMFREIRGNNGQYGWDKDFAGGDYLGIERALSEGIALCIAFLGAL